MKLVSIKDSTVAKSENGAKFEFDSQVERVIELLKFSFVQFYNLSVYALAYTFNFYFLSKKYTDPDLNSKIVTTIGVCNLLFNFFINCTLRGLTAGYDILASKRLGSRDYRLFYKLFFLSITICMICSCVLSLIIYLFGKQIIELFYRIDSEVSLMIDDYLFYFVFTIPLLSISFMFNKLVAVYQKNLEYSILLTINLAVEIYCSYLFIYQYDMKVSGASLSLFISRLVLDLTAILYFFVINPSNKEDINFSYESFGDFIQDAKEFIAFTLPNLMSFYLSTIQTELSGLIAFYYSSQVYIAYIAFSPISFFFSNVASTLGSAIITFCGASLGSKNIEEFKRNLLVISQILLTILFIFSVLILINRTNLLQMLVTSPEVLRIMDLSIYSYLIWLNISVIFFYISYILRTIHDQYIYMKISLVNYFLFQLAFISYFIYYLDSGLPGIYFGLTIGNIISIMMVHLYYKSINLNEKLNGLTQL